MKKAFTMIEIIFVIVIIGILSAIAIPKILSVRDDAIIAKNIEYVMAIITEVSTYIVVKSESENDLRKMSSILETLSKEERVQVDLSNKNVMVQIGEDVECIEIGIESNGTTDILGTFFTMTTDRICHMVQLAIKDKEYPLTLRGRLINY